MVTNNGCSLSPFERNKYFYGKMLTSRDFKLEQDYGIEKNRLISRLVLGAGIVCGLTIEIDKEQGENDSFTVTLSPGVALDGCGREIVVSKTKSQQLEFNSPGQKYLYIEYDERFKEPVADLNPASDLQNNSYSRIEETYRLFLSQDPPLLKDPKAELNGESLDELIQQYYDRVLNNLTTQNKSDRVLLAVADVSETGKVTLNQKETAKLRPIVRSNPMLSDLIGHVYDLAKQVTASQIAADSFISSDSSIEINPPTDDRKAFDFTLASANNLSSSQNQTRIFTGKRVLQLATGEDLPDGSLEPVSIRVEDLQEGEPFSVILAPQLPATVNPVFHPTLDPQDQPSGLHFIFGSHPELPRTYVAYVPQPYNKTFEIHGCDPNAIALKKVEVVYWVIAGAQEPSLSDRVLELLAIHPQGRTIQAMSRSLDVDNSSLETVLAELVDRNSIKRNGNNRYRLV